MSSMRFNARLDKSHHGQTHPFRVAGAVADSLTGIHNAMCLYCQQELHTQGSLDDARSKYTVDWNQVTVEAIHTHWVWQKLWRTSRTPQHKCAEHTMHVSHSYSLPVVHTPVSLEVLVVAGCKPLWQDMRAYQSLSNLYPHTDAELLLVSAQSSFSCNSVSGHMFTTFLSCIVTWN
jgi:hypothetical protein